VIVGIFLYLLLVSQSGTDDDSEIYGETGSAVLVVGGA
jgi:hypothetical protein